MPKAHCHCNVTAEIPRSSSLFCETVTAPGSPQDRDLCAQQQRGAACQGGTSARHISPTMCQGNASAQSRTRSSCCTKGGSEDQPILDGTAGRWHLPHAKCCNTLKAKPCRGTEVVLASGVLRSCDRAASYLDVFPASFSHVVVTTRIS